MIKLWFPRRKINDYEEEDGDYDTVVKLCFHCGRDDEYREDDDTCHYCGLSL